MTSTSTLTSQFYINLLQAASILSSLLQLEVNSSYLFKFKSKVAKNQTDSHIKTKVSYFQYLEKAVTGALKSASDKVTCKNIFI